jgi:long-chain-fatty-acid--CoA ligase ACSBG
LITAGGENVAPVLIENQVNTVLPIFSSVVVLGDKRKFLTALLCLKLKSN